MNNRFLNLSIISAVLAGLLSCDGGTPPAAPALVVDGWIDSGGYPVVILTKTVAPGLSEDISVADCLVRWGKVTISDGEMEVIMTGSRDDGYFPPYVYRTYDLRGEPGKTYRITAGFDGMTVSSSCTMPRPAEIKGVRVRKAEDSDSLCELSMSFVPAPDECCYHILTRVRGRRARLLPSFLGAVKVEAAAVSAEVPVFAPKCDTAGDDYSSRFMLGDTVDIALCTVTPEVYDFWLDYDDEVAFGGSQFVTSAGNLRSNVSGGYGVWTAQGVARYTVVIAGE